MREEMDLIDKVMSHAMFATKLLIDTLTMAASRQFVEAIWEIAENVTVEVIRGTGIQSLMNSQDTKK